jgi:YaiO family outer membrane protein
MWCRAVCQGTAAVLFAGALIFATANAWGQDASYSDLMDRAAAARLRGDFPAAEGHLRAALTASPQDVEATRLLALIIAFQGRLDEARATIERAYGLAPDNIDVRLSRARILGWSERFDAAEAEVDGIIAQMPDYADGWALKGRLAYYQQAYARSRDAFAKAEALAPGDLEVMLGLGDVALATGRRAEAAAYYAKAQQDYPESLDVQDRIARLAGDDPLPWRIDVDGEISSLSRTSLSNWSEQSVRLERKLAGAATVFGRVERYDRFSQSDWMIHGGGTTQAGDAVSLYGEAGIGLDPDFQPDWQLSAGGTARVSRAGGGIGASLITLDTRARHYDVGTVYTFDIGWQQYVGRGRGFLWAKFLNSIADDGSHLTGWSVSGMLNVSDTFRIRLGTALAPESDRGVVVDTRTYTGGVEADVSERVVLRLNATQDSRRGSYRRFYVRTGIGVRF